MDRARDATAVLAALALTALVALAARGTPLSTLVQSGAADRLQVLGDIGILLALGAVVAVGLTLLYHRAVVVPRHRDVRVRTTLLRATPLVTAALVAFSLMTIAGADLNAGAVALPEEAFGGLMPGSGRPGRPLEVVGWWASKVRAGEGAPDREIPTGGARPGPQLPPLVIAAAVLALLLAAAAVWRWYRSTAVALLPESDEDTLESERAAMRGVVMGSIDAMLADPDPRTAIIGAYARLLEHLAASGAGRHEQEAPLEHLRRVLTTLRVRPDPLRELIDLFELARFSTHPLDGTHRDRALAALEDVAGDLAPVGEQAGGPVGGRGAAHAGAAPDPGAGSP